MQSPRTTRTAGTDGADGAYLAVGRGGTAALGVSPARGDAETWTTAQASETRHAPPESFQELSPVMVALVSLRGCRWARQNRFTQDMVSEGWCFPFPRGTEEEEV